MDIGIDLQILNIIANDEKKLRDFVRTAGECIFNNDFRRFAKQLSDYYETYESVPTLNTLLQFSSKHGKHVEEYIFNTWEEIDKHKTDPKEYNFLLEKLNKRYNTEILRKVGSKLSSDSLEDIENINSLIFKAANEIKNIGAKKVYKEIESDNIDMWANKFRARLSGEDAGKGILSGFSTLDYYTGGIRKGELFIFGAHTGGGKSIWLINLLKNYWLGNNKFPESIIDLDNTIFDNSGVDILFVSMEMKAEDIEDRLMSCLCTVDSLDITKGRGLGQEDLTKLTLGLKFRQKYPNKFKIVEAPRGSSIADIQTIFDDVSLKFRPRIVIIDYMQLMFDSADDDEKDWERLKTVAEEMHEFSKCNDVSTWSAVQLKSADEGKRKPQTNNIGRSSMISHNCDLIMELEQREGEKMRPDAKIHCTKSRRTPIFVMNNVRKEFNYTRFVDLGQPESKPKQDVGLFGEDVTDIMKEIFGQGQTTANLFELDKQL